MSRGQGNPLAVFSAKLNPWLSIRMVDRVGQGGALGRNSFFGKSSILIPGAVHCSGSRLADVSLMIPSTVSNCQVLSFFLPSPLQNLNKKSPSAS